MKTDLPKNLYKNPGHLAAENMLRLRYEASEDASISLPHNRDFFLKTFVTLQSLFPDIITPDMYSEYVSEESFIPYGEDVSIFHHLTCFPPMWHTNEFFTIRIILDGEGTLYIADQELHMMSGNICIIAPEAVTALSAFEPNSILNILVQS